MGFAVAHCIQHEQQPNESLQVDVSEAPSVTIVLLLIVSYVFDIFEAVPTLVAREAIEPNCTVQTPS